MSSDPSGAPQASGSPGTASYREAILATEQCVQQRGSTFRRYALLIGALACGVVMGAILLRSPVALAGLLLLVPACSAVLLMDAVVLSQWRRAILGQWVSGDIGLSAFREAISAHPLLPRDTLSSMLDTLPRTLALEREQSLMFPTRWAAACTVSTVHDQSIDRLALATLGSSIVAGSLLAVIWSGRPSVLAGLVALALLPVVKYMQARRRARASAEVERTRTGPDFDAASYASLVGRI